MDWFQHLTGFPETEYAQTRSRLAVEGAHLVCLPTGRRYGIGELELASLADLRERVARSPALPGRLQVRVLQGDVRRLHQQPEFANALFQVASQFNLLEMVGPSITPEHGVTRYQSDPTQGPACAIAAGAATIYRNYFAPVGDRVGQTKHHQLDALSDLGEALASAIGTSVNQLWAMQNGYALCTESGLAAIERHLRGATDREHDALRARLRIGVHWDVEVTEAPGPERPEVSQAFCSALPVAYSDIPQKHWRSFAWLVLEAAYEATLLAAVVNVQRGGSNVVLLTRLGGGAFGNDDSWIDAAMRRALEGVRNHSLDVRLVSYGSPSSSLLRLAKTFEP